MIKLVAEFLRVLSDPEGGEALYCLHAADAAVRSAQAIRVAADVDPGEFARAHREICLAGRDSLPQFGSATLLEGAADADESVLWFETTELREGRKLVAAMGVHGRRVAWCTLAERVEAWSYADGLLHALADYPWMRREEPARARVLLDASYFRRHWRAPVKFNTLPDARFSCQMSTACCRHDFEITLPPEAQLLIDAMPRELLGAQLSGTQLPVRPDGNLTLKGISESCRFIGSNRQCLIHQKLGRQPFAPCAVFPFAFADTPDGIAVALSPICSSTRLGFGVAPLDREDDLRERYTQTQPRLAHGYRVAPGVEVPWENFRDIEKGLRDCLATDDLPLRRRLYVGSRLLGAVSRNEPIDTQRWLTEPQAAISDELRVAIHGMLAKILDWDRAALRTLPRTIPADLCQFEVREAAIVTRILQNTVFSKVYSYPFDLTTAHNFLIVLYLLTLVMQSASSGPLPDALWQELGSLGVHGLLKNVLHDGVPEGFRTVFGTSEFGQWALAA